nr:hypothetical protein [Tanacetum cinerariifolium]
MHAISSSGVSSINISNRCKLSTSLIVARLVSNRLQWGYQVTVYSQHKDDVLKVLKDDEKEHEEDHDKHKEIEETTEQRKAACDGSRIIELSQRRSKDLK